MAWHAYAELHGEVREEVDVPRDLRLFLHFILVVVLRVHESFVRSPPIPQLIPFSDNYWGLDLEAELAEKTSSL